MILSPQTETPFLDKLRIALFQMEVGADESGIVWHVNPLDLRKIYRESFHYDNLIEPGKRALYWTFKDGYTLLGYPVCVDINQAVGSPGIHRKRSQINN